MEDSPVSWRDLTESGVRELREEEGEEGEGEEVEVKAGEEREEAGEEDEEVKCSHQARRSTERSDCWFETPPEKFPQITVVV